MIEPVIIFRNVSKSYPQYHQITGGFKNFIFHFPKSMRAFKSTRYESLKDISFEVRKGECLGIIGRNGAGKSTTLGLMAGVLRPTAGEVIVKDRVSPLLELGAGFNIELTGRENIYLNGVLMGMTRREVAIKEKEIIEFSELGEFIDQPIRTYSSGMVTRLGFSVVACLDPELLLIDEILSVGDMQFQEKCLYKMLDFKQKGVTMILVSHSMFDIESICDRVMWIENHQIKMIGITEPVAKSYFVT